MINWHSLTMTQEWLKQGGGKLQTVRDYSPLKCICWFNYWEHINVFTSNDKWLTPSQKLFTHPPTHLLKSTLILSSNLCVNIPSDPSPSRFLTRILYTILNCPTRATRYTQNACNFINYNSVTHLNQASLPVLCHKLAPVAWDLQRERSVHLVYFL